MTARIEAKFDLLPREKVLANSDLYSQMVDVFERGYSKTERWMGRERFGRENIPNTSRIAALFAGEGNSVAFATLNEGRITAISAEKGYGVTLLQELAGSGEFSGGNPLWITADVMALDMINAVMSKRLKSRLIQDRLQIEQLYGQIKGIDVASAEHRTDISIVGKNGLKVWPFHQPYQIPGVLGKYVGSSGTLLAHHRIGAKLHPESTYLQYAFIISH